MDFSLPKMLAVMALLPALQACNPAYYASSVGGHIKIVSSSQPVDRLLERRDINPDLKERLAISREIRDYASEQLALPDNNSYRRYVDTGREYVSWAVYSSPEFSVGFNTWCFPVYGCVPYRGYFSEEAAEAFAETLREQGMDVYVGGVPAYSSLGWFDDPLMNTMVIRGDVYLAGVVFHELAHQRVYVQNDSSFNEAFAVTVEENGVEKWLRERGEGAVLKDYEAGLRRYKDFQILVAETRQELARLYASDISVEEMREAKAREIERLRARYRRLRDGKWNGYRGFDRWFDEPINNARLATISVYGDLVSDFKRLFDLCAGNYERFYGAVEYLGQLERSEREKALKTASTCMAGGS